MKRDLRDLWRAPAAAALILTALAGCTPQGPADDGDGEGLVLVWDGLEVWEHEIEPLLAYVRAVDRRTGHMSAVTGILEGHLLPLKLAQRAFPAERAEQRELAAGLRRVIGDGGYPELAARGKALGRDPCGTFMRHELPAAIATWAFAAEHIGQVSPLVETPQGFSLISTFDVERGATTVTDRAETCQVSFYTHGPDEFRRWYDDQKSALADRISYLHPDYRSALPPWMTLPEDQKP